MSKFFEEDFPETKKERKEAKRIASRRDRSKFKKTDREKREKHQIAKSQKWIRKQNFLRGRILAIFPEEISVDCEGELYTCVIKGRLKKELTRIKNLITVGDFVMFEKIEERTGIIEHVEERYSILSRKEHLRQKTRQLIAANIDQVLITVSVVHPSLKPALVDRYIIAAYKGNMQPVIVVNKMDLLKSDSREKKDFELFLQTYRKFRIPVIPLSAETGEGMDLLKKQMQNKASVFSGQSGVGKSSLINAMTGLSLVVREVIDKTRKGAHTTSAAQLIPLPFGGWCIDTPGIRSFGIWDLQLEDLKNYFPEISELSHGCKYPDCTHAHEPGCAVKLALERGEISVLRYQSYQKLLSEISFEF